LRIAIDMQGAQTGSGIRGIGRYTLSMSKAIIKHASGKHEVIIVLNGLFGETIEPLRKEFAGLIPDSNIKVWYAPGPVAYILPENDFRRKAAEYIREAFLMSLEPDVIWIPSLFEDYYNNAVISIGNLGTNIPVIVTIYDLIPLVLQSIYLEYDIRFKENYFKTIEYLKKASGWFAISNYTAQEAVAILKLNESNVVVGYPGPNSIFKKINIEENVKLAFKNRFGIKKDFLLHVGIVEQRKNVFNLLKAFSQLSYELRKNYQLVFAGGNPAHIVNQIIAAAGELGISRDEIILTGYISDEELLYLYNICKLSVFPSWYEGFGLPVVEAMACGTPIICANATSLPEVIENEDAMFNPFDVNDISNKITKALTDDNFRTELISRGLKQSEKFSWDESAKIAIKLFEQFEGIENPLANNPIKNQINNKQILINKLICKIGSIDNKNFYNEDLKELTISLIENFYVESDFLNIASRNSEQEFNYFPSVSIIINTDGRVKSLATCLESLKFLHYPNFEVVVVSGPTNDGTKELCQKYAGQIKTAECSYRNLSMSRNIGISISSGEIIGFLDDDAIPEPEWINDIIPAFLDSAAGVAGGFVHDHTGKNYQWTFGTIDRYGNLNTSWNRPTPEFNFPYSFNYPFVMANSFFRRTAIIDVRGFDEEYEYFLDEGDIILRCVDKGWKVIQLDKGFVHHKFMSSQIRGENRVLKSWYSVIKNKTYFSLVNNQNYSTLQKILQVMNSSIEEFRKSAMWAVNKGLLEPDYIEIFEDEVNRGLKDGLIRGFEGKRKLPSKEKLQDDSGFNRFKHFKTLLEPEKQRCYVFLSKTYPPGSIGGVGRYIHCLARNIAGFGHQVHVLTEGRSHDTVDFEEGVWVHRICPRESAPPEGLNIPAHLWNYSNTMYEEACEIESRRHIDCVYAPIWDVEGIAFLERRKFKLVTSLQPTMAFYLDTNPDKCADKEFVDNFAAPVIALEKKLMTESDGIHAISNAIAEEISRVYRIDFKSENLHFVPLGLDDWTDLKKGSANLNSNGDYSNNNNTKDAESEHIDNHIIRIAFIGRLEHRKGIDVFLEIAPNLIEKYENVYIDIVGNDKISTSGGHTFRSVFEAENPEFAGNSRIVFHGEVDDRELRNFYSHADIIIAPSRFESFGLVHLEAMMFGKPVIGCNIGGMKEIIEDGFTGLLAEQGNADSLRSLIEELIKNRDIRLTLGKNARESYLKKYTAKKMAKGVISILEVHSA